MSTLKMKNIGFAAMAAAVLVAASIAPYFVSAEVNAVTPSTNDANRDAGWAHVNQLSQSIGETELEFVNPRTIFSCFEYRTDGDTSQVVATNGGVNFNSDIDDGLYPYICLNNDTATRTIEADEYVEVRMVFGGERDERFDWTRFDVLADATDKADCMDGGYEDYGFENQGQCVRFVETGKDSR